MVAASRIAEVILSRGPKAGVSMISPTAHPKNLDIVYQIAAEIDALSENEKKVATVFLNVDTNQVYSMKREDQREHLRIGPLEKEAPHVTTDLATVSSCFREILQNSCKEINLLEGPPRQEASKQFWKCYDFYNEFEKKWTGHEDSSLETPQRDPRSVIKTVTQSIQNRNESLFQKIDTGFIALVSFFVGSFELCVLAYGGILAAFGIATGGGVFVFALGLLILTAGIAVTALVGIAIANHFHQKPLLEVEQLLKSFQGGVDTPEKKAQLALIWNKLNTSEQSDLETILNKETTSQMKVMPK
jgi:hypothetical protein